MVDGDTFVVSIAGADERVRIVGIDAPEDGECFGDRATAALAALVEGERVVLERDVSDRDRFGRLLRHVSVGGEDVGIALVEGGLALARRYPPDVARAARLEAAETEARSAQVGLWAGDACGPAADADIEIAEINADPPGDDGERLRDEWVRVRNTGGAPLDLTGWVLRDESASHRYAFPDGFVLAGDASVVVRTGCGEDTATDLHWCVSGSAVWNNDGDTAFLLDPHGNIATSRPYRP